MTVPMGMPVALRMAVPMGMPMPMTMPLPIKAHGPSGTIELSKKFRLMCCTSLSFDSCGVDIREHDHRLLCQSMAACKLSKRKTNNIRAMGGEGEGVAVFLKFDLVQYMLTVRTLDRQQGK